LFTDDLLLEDDKVDLRLEVDVLRLALDFFVDAVGLARLFDRVVDFWGLRDELSLVEDSAFLFGL